MADHSLLFPLVSNSNFLVIETDLPNIGENVKNFKNILLSIALSGRADYVSNAYQYPMRNTERIALMDFAKDMM